MSNKKDKRGGSIADQAWLVGKKPVYDLLKNKPDRLIKLYLLDGEKNTFFDRELDIDRSKVSLLSKIDFFKLFDGIESVHHQGICANITPSNSVGIDQLIRRSKNSGRGIIIGLDQVQDPHNLGSIFRTAEVLGADGLFFSSSQSSPVTPTVRRVSVGATEFLPYSVVTNTANAITKLKKEGYWIFGTSLGDESLDLEKTEILFPIVLMFGSESSGLRQLTEKLCDRLVHINQYGTTESLNVATAVSAVLYYARSKLNE